MVGPITTLVEIELARQRIAPYIRKTPLLKANHLKHHQLPSPCDLYLKLEQHQLTGSFKIRGVLNKILSTPDHILKNGIVAASGGNHGRAVAYAGWERKIPTTIFLPVTTPDDKIAAIKSWSANTIVAGADLDEANDIAKEAAAKHQQLFIHPYADPVVASGQGTLALELLDELPNVDTVIVAVGGGGLLAGTAVALKEQNPAIKIIGVEPIGCASMHDSLKAGKVVTIPRIKTKVGTLAIKRTTQHNFEIARRYVDDIVLISDDDMLTASRHLWQEFGIAGELSGVASYAALTTGKINTSASQIVCPIICGLGREGTL